MANLIFVSQPTRIAFRFDNNALGKTTITVKGIRSNADEAALKTTITALEDVIGAAWKTASIINTRALA